MGVCDAAGRSRGCSLALELFDCILEVEQLVLHIRSTRWRRMQRSVTEAQYANSISPFDIMLHEETLTLQGLGIGPSSPAYALIHPVPA